MIKASEEDAMKSAVKGENLTTLIELVCPSSVLTIAGQGIEEFESFKESLVSFLISNTATFLSLDPVAIRLLSVLLQSTVFISS